MHIYNMITGLPPPRGAGAPTRLETKSAYACKALLMSCDWMYLTSGFKTPTILQKFMNMAYLRQKKLARNGAAIVP